MTASEFISKNLESRFGVNVAVHNTYFSGDQWVEQMELYHQAKLKLLGITDVLVTEVNIKNPIFKTKDELREFIALNIPFATKATKPAKTMYVSTFTSNNAIKQVIDELTDKFWERVNQP